MQVLRALWDSLSGATMVMTVQQGKEARQLLESGIGMHCNRHEASFFKSNTN